MLLAGSATARFVDDAVRDGDSLLVVGGAAADQVFTHLAPTLGRVLDMCIRW